MCVRVERGAERGVLLVVVDAASAAADRTGGTGWAVVDGAEAGGGEGGEDARVCGDAFRDALAAAQARGDQVRSCRRQSRSGWLCSRETVVNKAKRGTRRPRLEGIRVRHDRPAQARGARHRRECSSCLRRAPVPAPGTPAPGLLPCGPSKGQSADVGRCRRASPALCGSPQLFRGAGGRAAGPAIPPRLKGHPRQNLRVTGK